MVTESMRPDSPVRVTVAAQVPGDRDGYVTVLSNDKQVIGAAELVTTLYSPSSRHGKARGEGRERYGRQSQLYDIHLTRNQYYTFI